MCRNLTRCVPLLKPLLPRLSVAVWTAIAEGERKRRGRGEEEGEGKSVECGVPVSSVMLCHFTSAVFDLHVMVLCLFAFVLCSFVPDSISSSCLQCLPNGQRLSLETAEFTR